MEVKLITDTKRTANCYIVRSGDEYAVVDPGEMSGQLREFALAQGDKLKYILLTHRHFDHILGTAELKRLVPTAKIVIHEFDKDGLLSDEVSLARRFGFYQEPVKYDITVKEGDRLLLGDEVITVVHTPGHTLGGVVYKTEEIMFTGDTLLRGNIGRFDFPSASETELFESLKKLCDFKEDYKLFPGHGGRTTLEFEKKNNFYLCD